MPNAGDLNALIISLAIQGIGGLSLVLICSTLYLHRRRSYFLIWTLSCICFSLWTLLRALSLAWAAPASSAAAFLPLLIFANLGGWLHAALLILGMLAFHQERISAAEKGTGRLRRRFAAFALLAAATLGSLIVGFLALSRKTPFWPAS